MPSSPPLRFHIKNARQGEPFDAMIAIQPEDVKPLLRRIDFPEDMGLAADLPNWRVHGTPKRSGEFQLVVEYRDDGASPVRSGFLPFIVNSDPETLWKDKPSDRNVPFWKADNAHDCVQGSDARIVAARRRGRSHAHNGTCCDDDYVIYADPPNGWQLAIVADGAGSAKFSRRGSQVATAAAAEFLRQQVFASQAGEDLRAAILGYVRAGKPGAASDEEKALRKCLFMTIGHAAHAAAKALYKEARDRADVIANVKDLSTTLLIGLACKIDSRWFCAAYWVGDGAVAVYRKNAEVILLGASDSGEFSGQTRFLTAEEVQQDSLLRRLRFAVVEDMTALILMTDGVSDAKFSSEAQLGKLAAWDAFWTDLGEARLEEDGDVDLRLLDWLDFRVSGEYDDRTIAIIY
ncbi:MAG: protein phosphatase 2C domain-containing protein [Azoarcus sp.]|nr:protein phosphatase 2C domain-containing protein [Azoarcus sp.]